MAARQFSSHQEHYPSRSGGTLGADRKAATALVYQDVVAGVASTVAIQGDDGSIIAIQASALNTDNVVFNAATVYVAALGGGMIYVEESDYNLAATWNVSVDIFVQGAGWDAVLNYNAGGNCITITGDNVKIRDLKIIIVAGAGAGGTRPNGIIATARDNIEIFGVWAIGDDSVADDGNNLRQNGILYNANDNSKILSCRCEDFIRAGIILNSSNDNLVNGCFWFTNTLYGILLSSSTDNILTNNVSTLNIGSGIRLGASSDNNNIINNMVEQNDGHGIIVTTGTSNIIIGNSCNDNDANDTGSFDGINIDNDSDDNIIMGNICNDNDRYGINIFSANCERNIVKNNQMQRNTAAEFNDFGTDTKLATKTVQFIQGTTFISADGSAKGWEINAEADMAVALGQLPLEVQQVVRIKIWAVALGAPAGAGGQMHLDILFNAGGSLEAYNLAANSWTLANFDGEEADYVNTDVIHWVVEDGDVGNEISNLLGGDSLELKVNGGTAVAPDGATNATFRLVEIEYV